MLTPYQLFSHSLNVAPVSGENSTILKLGDYNEGATMDIAVLHRKCDNLGIYKNII